MWCLGGEGGREGGTKVVFVLVWEGGVCADLPRSCPHSSPQPGQFQNASSLV
jgi:hypothetical protein